MDAGRELLEVLAELGPDERRVLLAVARRLAMGPCELLRATFPRPPATELPDDDEPSRGDLVIVEVHRAVG